MTDLGKKKREYNGLTIFELVSHPVTHATVCGGAEHQKWTGEFTIDRTEGSYRYGDELQFVVWSIEPPKIKMERARAHQMMDIFALRFVFLKMRL